MNLFLRVIHHQASLNLLRKMATQTSYVVELRSDTFTKPSKGMYEAMVKAPVGDAIYDEDPTINLLEKTTAELFGKEASLFMPSGTMANLVAGNSIIFQSIQIH